MALVWNGHVLNEEEEKEFRETYGYGSPNLNEFREKINKKYESKQ